MVFREETERKEGVKSGTIIMGGVVEDNIYNQCRRLIEDKKFYKKIASASNPYGDGRSSDIMLDVIEKYLTGMSLDEIQKRY